MPSSQAYPELFAQSGVCIIIPTYNNAATLQRVIDGALEYCKDVIVVNDGATDTSPEIIAQNQDKLEVITFPQNQGKGKALREGFKKAIELGFNHAITIDSDGQHQAKELPIFLETINKNPEAMVMGSRVLKQEGKPGKNSFANKFSNFWFWAETGMKLPDTQTGYRAYPLKQLASMRLFTTKFELEIEVIVRLAWRYVPFEIVPIEAIYDPDERVTHFRPGRDFFRISILNTVLVILTLLWHLPKRLTLMVWKKGLWKIIMSELKKPGESATRKAAGIGFGVFMGIFPAWGFQMLIAAFFALVFKLNKVLVLTASNISIPPMIPFILFGSYKMGGLFVENETTFESMEALKLEDIHINFTQYLIGSVVLALACGLLAFLGTLAIIFLKRLVFKGGKSQVKE